MDEEIICLKNLYKVIRIYTFEIGHPFLTVEDLEIGFLNYLLYAAYHN